MSKAHCPTCNRDDAPTRKEHGVDVFAPHNTTPDGDMTCLVPAAKRVVRAEDRR